MRQIRILILALAVVALTVAVARAGALRYLIDSEPAGLGTDVVVDFNPSTLTSQNETPDSIALFLPRHWRFDHRAVARECTPAQATAVACPAEAQIGYGHAVVHMSGYLFPGGETDGVAYITAFLGRPARPGDRASIVLEVKILGLDQFVNAANQYSGAKFKTTYSVIGRVIPLHAGLYGFEGAFNGFPGGVTIPPPLAAAGVTATVTRFKLLIGQVRRVKRTRYDVFHEPTLTGGTKTIRIRDHVLIGYHLLRKGAVCPTDNGWPYRIEVSFPNATQAISGEMRCHR